MRKIRTLEELARPGVHPYRWVPAPAGFPTVCAECGEPVAEGDLVDVTTVRNWDLGHFGPEDVYCFECDFPEVVADMPASWYAPETIPTADSMSSWQPQAFVQWFFTHKPKTLSELVEDVIQRGVFRAAWLDFAAGNHDFIHEMRPPLHDHAKHVHGLTGNGGKLRWQPDVSEMFEHWLDPFWLEVAAATLMKTRWDVLLERTSNVPESQLFVDWYQGLTVDLLQVRDMQQIAHGLGQPVTDDFYDGGEECPRR